ncbi:MAG: DUF4870 domain-containing protein [Planctomycetota bacterium]|nr:DUF4870 domain-containing protein [Planctomycetota bacterium]
MTDQRPIPVDTDDDSVTKTPPRRAVASEESETTNDQRLFATLAHILGIATGPFGALLIMLLKKDDEWVANEARKALNFQITVFLTFACGVVLSIILIGILVVIAAAVLNVVFCIIAAAHIHEGNPYHYPITLQLIKQPA